MACTSSCSTPGAHQTFGECMRAKGLRIGYCNSAAGQDYTAQKQLDSDLAFYRDARRQGVQPASTRRDAVEAALDASNAHGEAFKA